MAERYEWALSPSKFEASQGCACFEENPYAGRESKERGEDLHAYVEHDERPLDKLSADDQDAVEFCRGHVLALREAAGPFVFEAKEYYIAKCNEHPSAKLDYVAITEPGLLIFRDWKFGAVEVPPPEDNWQMRSYAYIAALHFRERKLTGIQGGIVQPALMASPCHDFTDEELRPIGEAMFKANDRVIDPFRQPDPSDPMKCSRCRHVHRCPAVCRAVATVNREAGLLPMPDVFDPGALVSVRDRVIAQDLAKVLKSWAEQVMEKNREFAIANGNTLGGIWNVSTRGNGVEIQDVGKFAEGLIEAGLMVDPLGILPFVKLRKAELIEGLASPDYPVGNVAGVVKELEQKIGVPRPPVAVFRRGGAKKVAQAEAELAIPQIVNPWKRKELEE